MMLMFQKDDYLFSFDLKQGYHHINIFEPIDKTGALAGKLMAMLNFHLQSDHLVYQQCITPLQNCYGL